MKGKIFLFAFLILAISFTIFITYESSNIINAKEQSLEASLKNSIIFNELHLKTTTKEYLEKKQKETKTSILFVGDIMLSRSVGSVMNGLNDYQFPFRKSYSFLQNADLTFGNLECPISDRGKNQGSKYSFRADPKVIAGLNYAGFDIMSVANNHIFDWGRVALSDTLSILNKNNIIPIGAGHDYNDANSIKIIDVNGIKVGFLAYTSLYPKSFYATNKYAGISDFNVIKISNYIQKLKSKNKIDLAIVSLHWGVEYDKNPSKLQIDIAHKLIDSGVDIMVGHHPHIVQKVERYKNGVIMYSLGNFVFDQTFLYDTTHSVAVKIVYQDKKIQFVEKYNIEINNSYQPFVLF